MLRECVGTQEIPLDESAIDMGNIQKWLIGNLKKREGRKTGAAILSCCRLLGLRNAID